MAESVPMPMCPMAKACKGMMEKSLPGSVLVLPGIVLIALGVAVLIEPRILIWLVAVALFAMGIGMLVFARFARKTEKRFQSMQR